ncbi:ABC transporter substrate-binding protein [Ancylobacter mangrovi]|uniref:ABC transporter substrate-binding protein n=1 Tax=Ancylobacter mangrovi TaxID=2972472 RepID=UPI002161BDF9|nr:ABC transporter substrate-binding protein [Ancylobacter mangrovi]
MRARLTLSLLILSASLASAHAQSTLRIGVQEDPDFLDPHRARSFASRIVFPSLCDSLLKVSAKLAIEPSLAASWSWSPDGKTLTMKLRDGVTFHDGEPFNAAAVKFNIERAQTLPDSLRKNEISSIQSVEAVDPLTVVFKLKQPDAGLLAQLADRAGMMLAPKAASGDVTSHPVCSGPYKFVSRVFQDNITLEKFDKYWNKDKYHFDRVIFRVIPDATVRLANLRSGDLDLVERVAPSDLEAAGSDKSIKIESVPGLAFTYMDINIGGTAQADTPIGRDPRVRHALDLSIDRNAINKVVFEGHYVPADQPFAPASPYHIDRPIPARDVAKAKQLLAEAGVKTPFPVKMNIANTPIAQQVGQMVQAMASEAGFDVQLNATEYATLISYNRSGEFQTTIKGFSGRLDPDAYVRQFIACKGTQNDTKYCDKSVDALIAKARAINDEAERKKMYTEILKDFQSTSSVLYLYFEPRIYGLSSKLSGFSPSPEGVIDLEGVEASAD